ncbi:MAG: NAD(P)-dependent oxidoreductase [Candidatus Bathyarchaeia archaeon]
MQTKVLVTGGAGRLGSELTKALSKKGYEVVAFDLPTANFEKLKGLPGIRILRGDITKPEDLLGAVDGIDTVFHLASILPPMSEVNRDKTMRVNVEGTRNLLGALSKLGIKVPIIFTSSVCVYGITADEVPPIRIDHPLVVSDNYSESKIKSEKLIEDSNLPYTILRVTGIYEVGLMELPKELQFSSDQRVEFIDRRCVIEALLSAVGNEKASYKKFNIAGGRTWQMRGRDFIEQVYSQFGIPVKANYSKKPGWFDWYDTEDSQAILKYQIVSFQRFLEELRRLARRLFRDRAL